MKLVMRVGRLGRRLWAKKVVRIIVVLLAVAIPAALWLNHWSSAPAATTIHVAQPATAATAKPTYKLFKTPYFTTEIPASWQPQAASTVNGRWQQVVVAPASVSGQLGFSSALIPSDGLNGIGDYKLRTSDTTTYKVVTDAALPAGSQTFLTAGTSDYTTFLQAQGRYAALSLTGQEATGDAHTTLLHILATWHWIAQ